MSRPVCAQVDVPADVETAWRAMTGPGWPQALGVELRDDSRLVSAEPTPDGGLVVVVSRRLPEGVPGPLRRFLPSDGRVTQTDTWAPAVDGARRGSWAVGFRGAPGTAGGPLELLPNAGGSRWLVSGTVQISVPLVGGQIEAFLAPLVGRLVVRQGEVLRRLVA